MRRETIGKIKLLGREALQSFNIVLFERFIEFLGFINFRSAVTVSLGRYIHIISIAHLHVLCGTGLNVVTQADGGS